MSSNTKNAAHDVPKVRLGNYIVRSTINNHDLKYGVELIEGVTNEGVFSSPKGKLIDIDLKPYKIVNNGAFVYNPSRLDLGSIAYRTEGLCIVSHLYIVFYLNESGKKIIDPEYLYIYFRRDEFYREVTFRNFGSQRPEFNFNDMSDIVIPLPDIAVQRKYVAIYKAMVANQKSYERGLEDLKLVCDGYIEDLRRRMPCEKIGPYIEKRDKRNVSEQLGVGDVKSINMDGTFKETVANVDTDRINTYKIVKPYDFAYTNRINIGSIAMRLPKDNDCLVSASYDVFYISKTQKIIPEYLALWIRRSEFFRAAGFYAAGSVKDSFSVEMMKDVTIPIPEYKIQRAIADIYTVYIERKRINEQLKAQIKDICPILIKGSLEEAVEN